MDAKPRGGLSGKARRVRERSRATRMRASQLLEDYYEPGAVETSSERYIPIRHRELITPSVEFSVSSVTSRGREAIVEPGSVVPNDYTKSRGLRFPARVVSRSAKALRMSCAVPATRSDPTLARAAIYGRRETFRWRGFMYGCAMGTAAASVLLICVRGAIS